MRIGSAKRPLNGPESRALRTGLHLERSHVARLVNTLRVLDGRVQNDDVTAWESAGDGYPYAISRLLRSLDAAVVQVALAQFSGGCEEPGFCHVVRPRPERIVQVFAVTGEHSILEAQRYPALVSEGGDLWQRLFDAVVERVSELCERSGSTLTISPGDFS